MTSRARVLVVDDSVVARRIIAEVLAEDDRIEVVGTAPNGRIALAKIPLVEPDVITLDVDMPELNGLEVLAVVRARYPKVRVIMVSSLTERGAKVTVDSLVLGASDYVAKASRAHSPEAARQHLKRHLVPKVVALAPRTRAPGELLAQSPASGAPAARRQPRPPEVVAVGASTGGPNALVSVLSAFPKDFPIPVLVVQHMPENFTGYLAQRLDTKCDLRVVEAQDGMRPAPGCAYVARGNHHLEVVRGPEPEGVTLETHQGPLVNSCRPSVDVLFRSVVRCYGGAALCVVLTGMGQDGLRGCREVHAAGGQIVVQDQASSVVWGMPGAVAEANLADLILPADDIGPRVAQRVRESRP